MRTPDGSRDSRVQFARARLRPHDVPCRACLAPIGKACESGGEPHEWRLDALTGGML